MTAPVGWDRKVMRVAICRVNVSIPGQRPNLGSFKPIGDSEAKHKCRTGNPQRSKCGRDDNAAPNWQAPRQAAG